MLHVFIVEVGKPFILLAKFQIDPNALLLDLNELLSRDPNLSSLQDPPLDDIISLNAINSLSPLGMAIPKRNQMVNFYVLINCQTLTVRETASLSLNLFST